MNLVKKLIQIFVLILLMASLASCGEGCVEAYQFDTETEVVDSYPVEDGVYGTYDADSGGQSASWHDTGLKSDGTGFIIAVSGSWTAWDGTSLNSSTLTALPDCSTANTATDDSNYGYCARRTQDVSDTTSTNCICHSDETQISCNNYDKDGDYTGSGCESSPVTKGTCATGGSADGCTDYPNNPYCCSCTTDTDYGYTSSSANNQGVLAYGIYHINLNYADKYGNVLNANNQTECQLSQGMGLYIGLFGSKGVDTPTRVYHMYSLTQVCDIETSGDSGTCVDSDGNSQWKYLYSSPNNVIFVKDDKNGNDGSDTDTSDDTSHKANEHVKILINDSYYNDNYGTYVLTFYGGTKSTEDKGLLQFLVSLVEDVVLGEENNDGDREGGILKFMYQAITQDTDFILILQVTLSLYVSFFGLAILLGLTQISRKELSNRLVKIALVLLFTSSSSWYLYDKIVVSFFKDSMDYVIAMMTSLFDEFSDSASTITYLTDNSDLSSSYAISGTKSGRFYFIDLVIEKLLSDSATRKIFGLFFGEVFFGMIYIPAIYALIGFFIYVMLTAATVYLLNMMKIVFALALGPIFMCFSLFPQTNQMFKNWVGFLGARSLEIILMFAVLYNFVVILDKKFTSMLYYRTCVIDWGIGPVRIPILKATVSHSFMTWLTTFVTIGGWIFMTKMVMDKIGELAGALIKVGGAGGGSSASFTSAGKMMGQVLGVAKDAAKVGLTGAGYAGLGIAKLGAFAARESGLAEKWDKLGDKIPFRSPRSMYRDSVFDGVINQAKSEAKSKGLTGKAADEYIRKEATKKLHTKIYREGNKMKAAGVNVDNFVKRLDKKLVQDPLKNFLKTKAKELKNYGGNNLLLGKAMEDKLKEEGLKWAKDNLSAGGDKVEGHLKNMKSFIREQGELGGVDAAKRFANDNEGKNRYLEHLKDLEFERHKKRKDSQKYWHTRATNWMSRTAQDLRGDLVHNAKRAQRDFKRELEHQEKPNKGFWKDEITHFLKPDKTWDRLKATKRKMFGGYFGGEFKGTNEMQKKFLENKLLNSGPISNENFERRKFEADQLKKLGSQLQGIGGAQVNLHQANLAIDNGDRDGAVKSLVRSVIETEEEKELEKAFGERLKKAENVRVDGTKELDDLAPEKLEKLRELQAIIADVKTTDDERKEAYKEAHTLLLTELDVKFGADISQAVSLDADAKKLLLKDSNLNIGGVKVGQDNDSKTLFKIQKASAETKLQMLKVEQKIKQFEKATLEKKGQDVNAIERQIEALSNNIERAEGEVKDIDIKINS